METFWKFNDNLTVKYYMYIYVLYVLERREIYSHLFIMHGKIFFLFFMKHITIYIYISITGFWVSIFKEEKYILEFRTCTGDKTFHGWTRQ